MPALFPRWSNTALGVVLGGAVLATGTLLAAPLIYIRTPYGNARAMPVEQPVEFDHRHHVRDNGIQCLYCHDGAESEQHAGIPETSVCMGCHGQVWTGSRLLAPVRASYFDDQSIAWRRVYDLPDFVYFHHGVHVQHGIACARCHGAVEEMARPHRAVSLNMDFCLDCHRNPPGMPDPGRALTSLTTCTACHR
ncbi:MAG TPA: cytochrome c3 family protein [Polyangiales bacterium]|nr:cytochrome c3 family protein [Polyangiales bacterium]